MPKISLPAFCLPFVTRAFRGGRGRRFAFFSVLAGLIAILVAFWLALGNGPLEQELRVGLDLEQSEWEREQTEFVLIVHDDREAAIHADPMVLESSRQEARALLTALMAKPTHDPRQLDLQARAASLLASEGVAGDAPYEPYFEWYDEHQVRRAEAIVANELRPRVVRYHSPLGVRDGFALLGMLSGSVLILLGFVFGPLAVGAQQAQEVHENTLQPLTGTALDARQLALGLASGPLAVVALLAMPQVALYLLASVITGGLVPAVALLVIVAAAGLALSLASQLVGHFTGRRRTPGVVGAVLLVLLGVVAAAGLGFGLHLNGDNLGATCLLPQATAFYLLHDAFASVDLLAGSERAAVTTNIAIQLLGMIVLAGLLLRVLERKIAGREGPALTRQEALVGMLTAMTATLVAMPVFDRPWNDDADELHYLVTLGMLAPVLGLLVMARVPVGDVPPTMRRIPLRPILGELAAAAGVHMLAVLLLSSHPLEFGVFHPVSLMWLVWSLGVLGLIAVRMVAFPISILSGVWLAFCGVCVAVAYGHAAVWASDPGHLELRHVFALGELSPVLGLIQVALLGWVPVSLVRGLRKNLAAI